MRKKILGLSTLVLMLLGLAACKAALGVPTLGNKPRVLKPGEVLIQVTVADDNFPAYRTVTPAAWDDTRKAKLNYTIYKDAVDPANVFNGFADIKWDDIKNGYHMAIGQTTTPLKLIMVARETTSGKIALISYKTDVTVPSSNLINFVLRPYRETKAESDAATKGSVDITLKFVDPEKNPDDPIKEAKCELKLAPGTTIGTAIVGVMCNVMPDGIISYKQSEVAPGVYEFTAELLRTSGKSAGKASSLVIVDPANESKDTLQIVRDLNTKPNAPKNLQVQYAKRPGDSDTTYEATFTWQDESYNEDEFVLTFYKTDGTTKYDPQPTVTTDPPATASHMIDRNVHKATATLTLGEQYKVSVQAKNEFGSSDEVRLSDLKTGDIVHLARITYKLNGGKVLNAAETTSPYYIAEDTDPANPAIGYYTGFKAGTPVMLPAEVLSTETGIPASVYHPFKPTGGAGGIDKLYTFKGWKGTAVAGDPGFQLTDGQRDSGIAVEAIWEEHDPLSITFPAYDEYCYIEGQNKILDAKINDQCNIKARVIKPDDYNVAETKWYADGAPVTGQESDTFTGSFGTSGLKHLMVVMKLTKAGAPDKWVSARCYVRVK